MHPRSDSLSALRGILVQVILSVHFPVTSNDKTDNPRTQHLQCPLWGPHTPIQTMLIPFLVPTTVSCFQNDFPVFCLVWFSGDLIAKISLHYCLLIERNLRLLGSPTAKVTHKPTLFCSYLKESQNPTLVLKATNPMNCPWPAY